MRAPLRLFNHFEWMLISTSLNNPFTIRSKTNLEEFKYGHEVSVDCDLTSHLSL